MSYAQHQGIPKEHRIKKIPPRYEIQEGEKKPQKQVTEIPLQNLSQETNPNSRNSNLISPIKLLLVLGNLIIIWEETHESSSRVLVSVHEPTH